MYHSITTMPTQQHSYINTTEDCCYHDTMMYKPIIIKQEEQVKEEDLLLTCSYIPTTSMSLLSYSDDYSTTTTTSSPDMMTFQYGIDQLNSCDLSYFPSPPPPILSNELFIDFYPQGEQEQEQKVVTTPKENRPFPCHLCKRAFARKHDLQRHIRVHTGDKPYVCACCKKAFARTDALKRHLRIEDQCRSSKEVLLSMKNNTGKRRKIQQQQSF